MCKVRFGFVLALVGGLSILAGSAQALPLNVGHRGYSAANPENTLVAIEQSFLAGAAITEIDLLRSSDGHVVIFHDDSLSRTTNGSGPLASKTLAELKTLDAGSWFAPEFAGEQIPTLIEALTLQQTLGMGPLLLDQKSGLTFGADIVAALAATGASATDDILVTAWDLAQVADIQALLPGTQILWTDTDLVFPDTIAGLQAAGVSGFSIFYEQYLANPTFLTDVHAAGMDAFAWNIDALFPETVAKMEGAITLGLDGYIVNDPALFSVVLALEPSTLLLLGSALGSLWRCRPRPV